MGHMSRQILEQVMGPELVSVLHCKAEMCRPWLCLAHWCLLVWLTLQRLPLACMLPRDDFANSHLAVPR